MTRPAPPAKAGLEGVVATSSAVCYLDGARGVLAYCGYDIHELAEHATFEEVCYLLWHRRLPTRAELGELQTQLAAARPLGEPMLRLIKLLPPGNAMDALRTLASALSHYDPEAGDTSPEASYRQAIRLTAQLSSVVAAYGRVAAGQHPVEPNPTLGHAANFLLMLNGERPTAVAARALDIGLILHADHELNASSRPAVLAPGTLARLALQAAAGTSAPPFVVLAPGRCPAVLAAASVEGGGGRSDGLGSGGGGSGGAVSNWTLEVPGAGAAACRSPPTACDAAVSTTSGSARRPAEAYLSAQPCSATAASTTARSDCSSEDA